MKRFLFVMVLLSFVSCDAAVPEGDVSFAKPNVILINVDDLGYSDIACFGSKYYETPNIDRLAQNGIRFTNAYAACAVCSPTRASVLTGRYPARIGITDWIRARFQGGKIPEDGKNPSGYVKKEGKLSTPKNPLWLEHEEVTIAEALKQSGYVTCHIGKWHLGPDDWYPTKQGFDFNYGGCDYGQPPVFYDPYITKSLPRGIPHLKGRQEGEYLTDREADEAAGFIKKHKDQPFFIHYAPYAVHTPIQPKKSLLEKYKKKERHGQKNPAYATMVESVDQAVGTIVKTLNEFKLTERTMIIFTSDNGGLSWVTNNAPLRSGKGYPYEGGIRVPQIISYPALIKKGQVTDVPVISADFMPTICALTKTKLPDREIDGLDLTALLEKDMAPQRENLYWHFPHYRGKLGPYSIIRSGDWKMIKRYGVTNDVYELYDLKNDLGEKTDLSKEHADKVKTLDTQLKAWLKKVNAKLPKKP